MKKILALLLALWAIPAAAQQPIFQSGFVTPGHSAVFITNGVVGDGGAPSGGVGLLGSFVINDMLCASATGTSISVIDCGFSATGTNNWVGLQNLNGGATAPTRSPGDSTTNVATTAFVQNAFGLINWVVSTRPSPVEVWPDGAFTGDNANIKIGINYSIVNAATLGEPSTGYVYTPEATPIVGLLTNVSGWNQSLSSNDGRTMAAWLDTFIQQDGQGDAVNFFCNDQLNQHLVGATSWLANPAITCIVGQFAPSAGGAGGFINPENWIVFDNGFNITSIMTAANGTRNAAATALGEVWYGTLYQSLGTQPWDAYFKSIGPSRSGVDFSQSTFTDAAFKAGTPWVQANSYAAGSAGTDFLGVRGTIASKVTDGVAAGIFQTVTNFAGVAPAAYISTQKYSTSAAAYGIGIWAEAVDAVGGTAGNSVSGGRFTASCIGGTGGNCTGATNLGVCSVSYAYCLGAENQSWNDVADATTSFSAAKFATPVLSTCAGTKKCDAAFLANPNIVAPNAGITPNINGINFPTGTIDSTGSVLIATTATTYGINLLNATCSTACFRSPSYLVDGSGNVTSNSESPNAYLNPNLLISKTAPTIGSCGGGSPAISANNGTAAFRVTVGSATSTCAITLPTATTGWNCYATDLTTTSTTVFVTKQTLSGVSGVTLGNFNDTASAANWATSDVLAVSCFAL